MCRRWYLVALSYPRVHACSYRTIACLDARTLSCQVATSSYRVRRLSTGTVQLLCTVVPGTRLSATASPRVVLRGSGSHCHHRHHRLQQHRQQHWYDLRSTDPRTGRSGSRTTPPYETSYAFAVAAAAPHRHPTLMQAGGVLLPAIAAYPRNHALPFSLLCSAAAG